MTMSSKFPRVATKLLLKSSRFILRILGFNSGEIQISHLKNLKKFVSGLESSIIHVIDGGANVGEFTELILKFNPDAKVILVEPQPDLVSKLKQKFTQPNIRIAELALGAKKGHSKLYLNFNGDRKASMKKIRETQIEVQVATDTIEGIITNYSFNQIDILKLDLEGANGFVLAEFFKTSTPRPRVVILEVSYLSNYFGYRPREIYDLLNSNSYSTIYRATPRIGLIKVDRNYLTDYEGHTQNWIAILAEA